MESTATTAIMGLGAAVACWLLVIAGHPVWAFAAAVVGLLLGFTGLFTSGGGALSRNPAGLTSVIAVVISLLGIALIGVMFGRIFMI